MGNAASNEPPPKETKTRNHSIAEFEYLLDPAFGGSQKSSPMKSRSATTIQTSSKDNGSAKLVMLQQAKESGAMVSKKDILNIAAAAGGGSSAPTASADATTIVPTSLREIAPPSSEGNIVHPAKWLWKHPEFTLCMDEHGNTYYYNYNTQESTWDPPADMSLPKAEISFTVAVPADATPGRSFSVQINGTQLEVMCPVDARPGMTLELSNGETTAVLSASASIESIPEGGEGETVGAQRDAAATPVVAAASELPTSVDDDTLWKALADVAQVLYACDFFLSLA